MRNILNGRSNSTSIKYFEAVQFTCNAGFWLSGPATSKCVNHETLTKVPQCLGKLSNCFFWDELCRETGSFSEQWLTLGTVWKQCQRFQLPQEVSESQLRDQHHQPDISHTLNTSRPSSLDMGKSPDFDKIPTRLLKETAKEIAPARTSLYRMSFRTGDKPQDWKDSTTTPIPNWATPLILPTTDPSPCSV